jgi:hypothetical protein
MNGDSLSLVTPKFTVGTWDTLTSAQRRIFITYVRANFGGEVGADPGAFTARLWNDSVSTANSSTTPASDRLLNLSRLTTFVGVTSMWEKRNVIDYTVEQGIFVVQMIKEVADMKIINLGIGM